MVRLLLLGDLHLSTTGPPAPPSLPDLDSLDVDGIVSVGDVIDDNADHADDATVGAAYEKRGRAFLSRLSGAGVPVVAVPGNHDPVACTRRLADGLDDVVVAHRRVVDGTTLSPALDGVCFVGWGCEQFDLTPAFGYDRYPGIVPDRPDARVARESAAAVESVVGRFLAGELDGTAAAAELGVAPGRRGKCASELGALAEEFEALRSLLADAGGTTVLLCHESPFHVDFDYHHSVEGGQGRLHRGSIPLKMAIAAAGPEVALGGHVHREGRDVVGTVEGYADVYSPGSPGVAVVEVDSDVGSLRVCG